MEKSATETGVLFINVFKVEAQNQEKLAQILKESVEAVISKQDGYLSNRVLKSKDGTQVIVFARWRNIRAVEATRSIPQNAEYLKRIQELGAQANPGVYETFFSDGENG